MCSTRVGRIDQHIDSGNALILLDHVHLQYLGKKC